MDYENRNWKRALSAGIGLLLLGAFVSVSPADAGAEGLNALLQNIRSETSEIRVEAARTAAQVGPAALVPLGESIDSEGQFVVKDIKQAMRNIVNHAGRPGADGERQAAAEELAKLLDKERSAGVRNQALYLLGFAGGSKQVSAVAEQLYDQAVCEEAAACLERIPGEEATKALTEAVEKVPGDFKRRVLAVIGLRKDQAALPALERLFETCGPLLRIDVLDAMVKLGKLPADPPTFPATALVSERDNARLPDIFLRIADLYREEGNQQRAKTFYEKILEGAISEHVACAALIGLGKLGDPASLPLFGERLSDDSASIRGVAAQIVSDWPGEGVDGLLRERFAAAKGEEKEALLKVLVQRESEGVEGLLRKALSDDDQVVRVAAFRILGDRGGRDLEETFLNAARGEDAAVAKEARMAYLKLADRILPEGDEDHTLGMYYEALGFTGDADAMRKAFSGIAGLGKAESVAKVKPLIEDPSLAADAARTYLALGEAIGKAGNAEKQEEMILDIIHHPNSGDVRNLALRQLKELGKDTSVFTKRQGFINSWWAIGPFPNEKNQAFGKAYFPEKEIDLDKGGTFEGNQLAWKKVETDEIPARISLSKEFPEHNQFVTAYAYVELDAPGKMPVLFLNGTNDGCEFWVNGEKLFQTDKERGCEVDGDRIETTLKKGKNQVLLKVLQGGGGWEFCVRLADPDGKPIDLTQVQLLK